MNYEQSLQFLNTCNLQDIHILVARNMISNDAWITIFTVIWSHSLGLLLMNGGKNKLIFPGNCPMAAVPCDLMTS